MLPPSKRRDSSRKTRKTRRRRFAHELLEERTLLATFAQIGSELRLSLDAGEAVQVSPLAAETQYQLSEGTWSGSDSGDVSGAGSATLSVSSSGLATLQTVVIEDGGPNASVEFQPGAQPLNENYTVELDQAGSSIMFSGALEFAVEGSVGNTVELEAASVQIAAPLRLPTDSGGLTIRGDSIDIGEAATSVIGHMVTLAPQTADREISLGAEAASRLSLTDAELGRVQTEVLHIGGAEAGSIYVAGSIDLDSGQAQRLHLETGGEVVDDSAQVEFDNGIGSIPAYTVIETLFDGAEMGLGLGQFPGSSTGEAILSQEDGFTRFSVLNDGSGNNRIFGGFGRNTLQEHDFDGENERVRIVFRAGPENEQSRFTLGLVDLDSTGTEQHQYHVRFDTATELGNGFFEAFVDTRVKNHTNTPQDGIVNFDLTRWQIQSYFSEGQQNGAPGLPFEVDIKSIELVVPNYIVLEELLDGANIGYGFGQWPPGESVLTQFNGFARLSVTGDANNDNRYFGLVERANRQIHEFTPDASSLERVRIVYREGAANEQARFNFVLYDQDPDASSREQHQYLIPFGTGTPVGDGYYEMFVDLTQSASHIHQRKDGIRNFGFDQWKLESIYGDGQQNGQLGQKFQIDVKSIELVRFESVPKHRVAVDSLSIASAVGIPAPGLLTGVANLALQTNGAAAYLRNVGKSLTLVDLLATGAAIDAPLATVRLDVIGGNIAVPALASGQHAIADQLQLRVPASSSIGSGTQPLVIDANSLNVVAGSAFVEVVNSVRIVETEDNPDGIKTYDMEPLQVLLKGEVVIETYLSEQSEADFVVPSGLTLQYLPSSEVLARGSLQLRNILIEEGGGFGGYFVATGNLTNHGTLYTFPGAGRRFGDVYGAFTQSSTGVMAAEIGFNFFAEGGLRVYGNVDLQGSLELSLISYQIDLSKDLYLIAKNSSGPVTGVFSEYSEGDEVQIENRLFEFSYAGGDGNDVALDLLEILPFQVTNTLDSGPGSLRQAILDSNADSAVNDIRFDLPGEGAWTIDVLSPLPVITDNVNIDGMGVEGYNGSPLIALDGAHAGNDADGLVTDVPRYKSGRIVITGLAIGNFDGYGIRIGGETDIFEIEHNYIGTDVSGEIAWPNRKGGLLEDVQSNRFGPEDISHNLISGNGGHGIQVKGRASLYGNFIGTTADGLNALPNAGDGIYIEGAASIGRYDGESNVISGNFGYGVRTSGSTRIGTNYIGVDATGASPLHNQGGGIFVSEGAQGTVIGFLKDEYDQATETPSAARDGNVIAGRNDKAVVVVDGAADTEIHSNWIGTDRTATQSLGGMHGIVVRNNAQRTKIGGEAYFDGEGFSGGFGNIIKSQQGSGVVVESGQQTSLIENEISQNGGVGVDVRQGKAELRRNLIHDNAGESLQLAEPVGTLIVNQARLDGYVLGEIQNATPNTLFTLDFFSASNSRESEIFLGSNFVLTDSSGNAAFELSGLADFDPAALITALMTGASTDGGSLRSSSLMTDGVFAQAAVIRGLPTRSVEGRPIRLEAFAQPSTITGYAVTGYYWEVLKDGEFLLAGNDAGMQFSPDDEGIYTVRLDLNLTLIDPSNNPGLPPQRLVVLGPHDIAVRNLAPTPQFDFEPQRPTINEPVTFTSDSSDPGQDDLLSYTWEMRAGSPSNPVITSDTGEQFEFTPGNGGVFFVTLIVDDNDGEVRSLTRQFEVGGLPASLNIVPPPPGNEGDTVRLRAPESVLQRAEQFGFVWSVFKDGTAYPFTTPSVGVVEFIPNDNADYTVGLTLTESGNSLAADPVTVAVTNTSPTVTVTGDAAVANLNDTINFAAAIFDPGNVDTHAVSWTVRRNGRLQAATGTGPNFAFTPDADGAYVVEAQVRDDDYDAVSGVGQGIASAFLLVVSEQASIVVVTPNPTGGVFHEGTSYAFTADSPAVASYQWQALNERGEQVLQASDSFSSPVAVPEFPFTPPQGGNFVIQLDVIFADGSSAVAVSDVIEVTGLAPTIDELLLISPSSSGLIGEGSEVVLRAPGFDPGEPLGLTYSWTLNGTDIAGDEDQPNQLTFMTDNDGDYDVVVTVTDSQGLSNSYAETVSASNTTPSVQLVSAANNDAGGLASSEYTFEARGTDPSSTDQANLGYQWLLDGVDVTPEDNPERLTISILDPHGAVLTVVVSDSNGDSASAASYIILGNGTSPPTPPPPPLIIDGTTSTSASDSGAQQILVIGRSGNDNITIAPSVEVPVVVFGGDGNDTISGAGVSQPLILDGGAGNDNLTGGEGNDLLIAGTGNNTLVGGNGNNYFRGGGNDNMTGGSDSDHFEVHFSQVEITDVGGHNTVDLSQVPQGVTLDFGSQSGTPQTVFPGSTLRLTGTFQQLIGTAHNDTLTASPLTGSRLDAGAGNDVILSTAQDAIIDGGAGNDSFTLAGAGGTINAGSGNDTITGDVQDGTQVRGGDGNDTIDVQGFDGVHRNVYITGGTGTNSITATAVSGKIFASSGRPDGATSIFGSSDQASSSAILIDNSQDVDIFGSTTATSSLSVANSQDVGIFASPGDTVTLDAITRGNLTGGLFGSGGASNLLTATVTNSSNVSIFGSTAPNTALTAALTNSSDIDIFGSPHANALSISGGSDIGIYGLDNGSVQLSGAVDGSRLAGANIRLSQFGSTESANRLALSIDNVEEVSIFGSTSVAGTALEAVLTNSSDVSIFGGAVGAAELTVSSSSDIGIYGISDGNIHLGPQDPNTASGQVVNAIIQGGVFGSAMASDKTLNVIANNSEDVGIFGGVAGNVAAMNVSVSNSSDVGIFGSASGGLLSVSNSSDVSIYGGGSQQISLDQVAIGNVFTDIFGSVQPTSALQVNVSNNSQDVGIFGSAKRNAAITVADSSNISIHGGTAQTTLDGEVQLGDRAILTRVTDATVVAGAFGSENLTAPILQLDVLESAGLQIFGSVHGTSMLSIAGSQDIGIYGRFGDQIALSDSQSVRIEGGVFGTAIANTHGLRVTATNSSDIGIYGSTVEDSLRITGGSQIGIDLRDGDDELEIDGAMEVVAITDNGNDFATVRSGNDILVYLAEGADHAQVLGGTRVRIIGGDDDDQLYLAGGSQIDLDSGAGNDIVVTSGGQAANIRSDEGSDTLLLFGASGLQVNAGTGNDSIRSFGSFGTTLTQGAVHAVLDGGGGNDYLSVSPLESFTLSKVPNWIVLPADLLNAERVALASSLALIGGTGDDYLVGDGSIELYLLGGSGNDDLRLSGITSRSTLAGGSGDDRAFIRSSGLDNTVFGDAGADDIHISGGSRNSVFAEEGDDSLTFDTATKSFARGGDGHDQFTLHDGQDLALVGESGNDTFEVWGGLGNALAGGLGEDVLTSYSGTNNVFLGESGRDTLQNRGSESSIFSGGDGDDRFEIEYHGGAYYGDDGDDDYVVYESSDNPGEIITLREIIYIHNSDFELEARGSDSLDLSAFSDAATVDLRVVGQTQQIIADKLNLTLIGSFENVVGTSANDSLTGNAAANRLEGGAGNDALRGLEGDDLLIGGSGNDGLDGGAGDDIYRFGGVDLGSDTIREANGAGNDTLDFSNLSAGINLDLTQAGLQDVAPSLLSLRIVQSAVHDELGEIENLVGTAFGDNVMGNPLDNRFELLGGDDAVDGGGGRDVYVFAGRGLGSDMITDVPDDAPGAIGGLATLDFSGFDGPLNLDLSLTASQDLGELSLQFSSPIAILNAIGTSYNDTILGNSLNNALYGAAGSDVLDGREGDDLLVADLPAVVLLDFETAFSAARGDYDYTTEERNAIQSRLESSYAAFNWIFTQSQATANALTETLGRAYVRLAFSEGRGGGVSGDAGEVDFRNISRSVVSEVNINPLKGAVADTLPPDFTPEQYSEAIVSLSATIAAHELAHTAGVRHADAFGPIGSGLFDGADLSRMYPIYTGPFGATETPHHIIASPASVGSSIVDAIGPTFFGPREAIKLAFNETGHTQRESATGLNSHNTFETAEDIGNLVPLYVPNLAPASGFTDSGHVFRVAALAVVGDLRSNEAGDITEVDFYKFSGLAGEWVNVELMANAIRPARGTPFDGTLQVFDSEGNMLAENDDELEGTKDATLFDVQLPTDGVYFVRVALSPQPAIDSAGGRYELFLSRFTSMPANTELPSSPGDTLRGGAGANEIHGAAANDLVLATDAVFGDPADTLFGHDGFDTLDPQGFDYAYNLPAGHSIERIIGAAGFEMTAPTEGAVGQPLRFVLDARDLPVGSHYEIDWGDESPIETVDATNGTLTVRHQYLTISSVGEYVVVVTAKDADGDVIDEHQSSPVIITHLAIADEGGQQILYAGGTSARDSISVIWLSTTQFKLRLADGSESEHNYGTGSVERIVLHAFDGNDTLYVDPRIDIPSELYGGTGNDRIYGGGGDDILVGGAGHDRLYGYGGANLLIGGVGRDYLYTAGSGDIQIAGWTTYDNDIDALRTLAGYWASAPTDSSLDWYQTRVSVLNSAGVSDGVHTYRLDQTTVKEDADRDVLYGDFARPTGQIRLRNWYSLKRSGPGVMDVLLQDVSEEIVTDTN